MNVLEVEGLSVTFDTAAGPVVAVDRLDYEVREGEILAIVGESGCGKSVGVLSLLGLQAEGADVTGSVRYRGTDLLDVSESKLRELRGRDIAYIFQDPMTALNPLMTVGTQVAETLRKHLGMSKRAARERVVELLEIVGIPAARERLGVYPHQLSGGMRQRVMIAMAIACDPQLLIADEPTTALDVTVQAGIIETLKEIRDRLGMAVIIITHDMGVVADIADRVVVMYAGKSIEQAPVVELFEHPTHPYTRGLLEAVPQRGQHATTDRLRGISGNVPVLRAVATACSFADRCAFATDLCREARPVHEPVDGAGHSVSCWHPQSGALLQKGA
ncbi:ABC transporter ATP-binding protein [Microbacterium sp. MYb62]|uniref:ABC transporter ATP-binding protein n=1 Tax=Microbacterium sp. MYb62 TaxID=1848690 RepID=UPI000CFC4EF0|nr:ABC transporter ATP-binding protein [Microbacterium sp. MYb62]PRB18604.1 ABC transporter ATP-binding protein [Microbacterium sp. MYb62]